jgi:pilus assembly protein CpaF
MTTAHANSPKGALRRLETMAMMDDIDMPLTALRAQVASAVQLVVQVERTKTGQRRVSEIAKVKELDSAGDYVVCKLFGVNKAGELEWIPETKEARK